MESADRLLQRQRAADRCRRLISADSKEKGLLAPRVPAFARCISTAKLARRQDDAARRESANSVVAEAGFEAEQAFFSTG